MGADVGDSSGACEVISEGPRFGLSFMHPAVNNTDIENAIIINETAIFFTAIAPASQYAALMLIVPHSFSIMPFEYLYCLNQDRRGGN